MSQKPTLPVLPEEYRLTIKFNDSMAGTLICSPGRMLDLAFGWALAQGAGVEANTHTEVVEDLSGATITFEVDPPPEYPWNSYLLGGFDAGSLLGGTLAAVPASVTMNGESFENQLRLAFDEFRTQRGSGGYHHAALISESAIVTSAIDISRHNAVDKVVGYVLRNRIDPDHHAIVLSGRISADIALKGARAGVPVIATRSLPTIQAVELADAAGMMLVCRALDHRRVVYGSDRLT